jgi:hypothetical protein
MNVKINIPTQNILVPAIHAGPIIAALETAKHIQSEGWGKDQKWTETTSDTIKIEFVGDDLLSEKTPPLQRALDDYEAAQNRWLAEYNKRNAAEKEVADLKAKIEALKDEATKL